MKRYLLNREFYTPKGARECLLNGGVAYLYEHGDVPYAVGFAGKAQKPTFNYRFKSADRRAEFINAWGDRLIGAAKARDERKQARKSFRHSLTVGDMLRSSWGYDQTNIDFYEVTEVNGKTVTIREVAQQRQETGYMSGDCVPVPGQYIGKPMRKLVQSGDCVKIESFAYARKIEGKTIGGVKVFPVSNWTAYA